MTVLLIAVAFVILIVIGAIVVGFLCEEPDAEDGDIPDED
jgi:hypothetical protein